MRELKLGWDVYTPRDVRQCMEKNTKAKYFSFVGKAEETKSENLELKYERERTRNASKGDIWPGEVKLEVAELETTQEKLH